MAARVRAMSRRGGKVTRDALVIVVVAAVLTFVCWSMWRRAQRQAPPPPPSQPPLPLDHFVALERVAERLRVTWRDRGDAPTGLTGLLAGPDIGEPRSGADEDPPIDPWGRPYLLVLEPEAGVPLRVFSLGRDGQPGGGGADLDVHMDIVGPSEDETE